ncbi:MAG TPA: tRNA 2-thiouridine(34) synthase MnmA [Actinomycetota bacterium]|nr:tRNA 2-thiouridine(34) synthase MnmA [Actinomycetota bacterium]
MPRRKAVVAMSGGVDSSVAAALLVEQGYDVTGVMLKLWKGEAANTGSGCCNLGAAEDARRVADALSIPFYVLNFADFFEATVRRDFHEQYLAGRTPNPCVRCNHWVKFDALLDKAAALGADLLATGHYARVDYHGGRYRLRRGVDPSKDQSYVLWMLGQRQLARCAFPVGSQEKSATRALAAELGLRTARKPDSQEICFVRDGDFDAYVGESMPAAAAPGPILDLDGAVVGTHRGIGRYTIGQRKGLGVALGRPVFVTSIDARANALTVGGRDDLLVSELRLDEVGFVHDAPPDGTRVLVQYRAHGDAFPAIVDGSTIRFDEPVEAAAPGQSAALYSADDPAEVLGGGVIASSVSLAASRSG